MRIYPEKLAVHLQKTLAPLYWIAGDDHLLAQEASDSVRAAALMRGFSERKTFYADKKEHWLTALTEANSLSLFADKILVDIRTSTVKFDDDALLAYLKKPNPNTAILISSNKADSSTQKTQWFKALENACVFVPILPLERSQFPAWLATRAQKKQLNLSKEALALLAEHTEGNLLAALQELEKLTLLFIDAAQINAEQLRDSINDNARYDVFAFNDALLAGDASTSLRVLGALQQEGTAALAIIAIVGRELRQLAATREEMARGLTMQTSLRQSGVWDKRVPLLTHAAERLTHDNTRAVVQRLAAIDQACKGMSKQNPWQLLASLCLMMANLSYPPHIS